MTLNEFVDRVGEALADHEYPREDLEVIVQQTLNSLHSVPEKCDTLLPAFVARSRLNI